MVIYFITGVLTGIVITVVVWYCQFRHDTNIIKKRLDISDELKEKYDDL